MILVDTNVLVDVIHQDPIWLDWSLRELIKAQNQEILTNYVVYAELHTHNTAGPHIDAFLQNLGVKCWICLDLPHNWPRLRSGLTANEAAPKPASCPTSSLARMRKPRAFNCSPAMQGATAVTFQALI